MSVLVKKCCHCRSDLDEENKGQPTSVKCARCAKNEKKYGQPTTCAYCQLPAAFLGGKCVFCAASERKLGAPVACANCHLKAAFTKSGHRNRPRLCRMCVMQARANKLTTLAGVAIQAKTDNPSQHKHKEKQHKRKHSDGHDKGEEATSSKTRRERDPLADSGENVLLVQQLRDQIARLNGVIQGKEATILEKEKKIAALQADLSSSERKNREKFQLLLKEKEEAIQSVHEKYRQANKQEKKKT